MPNQSHASPTIQETTPAPFSWRREVALATAVLAALGAAQALVGWYNGQGLQANLLVGMAAWFTALMALGARRRWRQARDPAYVPRRWRFSTGELLVLFTGLIVLVAFVAIQTQQLQRLQREREALEAEAAPLLGLEGRLNFDFAGNVSISIADRTFDDRRLDALAELIARRQPDARVQGLMLGTGPQTRSTPPVWPGLTDRSVPLLLSWRDLEWLFVEGTSITPAQRRKLQSLPKLHDVSRQSLRKEPAP